jgi:hypothetical protein
VATNALLLRIKDILFTVIFRLFVIEKGIKIHLGYGTHLHFPKKDPEYKAYYTYTLTRINKHHQASPPADVAPNFVKETTNIEV